MKRYKSKLEEVRLGDHEFYAEDIDDLIKGLKSIRSKVGNLRLGVSQLGGGIGMRGVVGYVVDNGDIVIIGHNNY